MGAEHLKSSDTPTTEVVDSELSEFKRRLQTEEEKHGDLKGGHSSPPQTADLALSHLRDKTLK